MFFFKIYASTLLQVLAHRSNILANILVALLVGRSNIVVTILPEASLKLSSVPVAEKNLFTASWEQIATSGIGILLLVKVKECDLIVKALSIERNVGELGKSFAQGSRHYLARKPIE